MYYKAMKFDEAYMASLGDRPEYGRMHKLDGTEDVPTKDKNKRRERRERKGYDNDRD